MNTKKVLAYGTRNLFFAIAVILTLLLCTLSLTGCDNGSNSSGGNSSPTTNITYTVSETGGIDGTADSTGIVFTFNKTVAGLNAADITVYGAAEKSAGALTGSGVSWEIPITVNYAGLANVSINKKGIEAETKSVLIYKTGQFAITWELNGGLFDWYSDRPDRITKNAILDKPDPDPTKAGYEFVGWYTDSALTVPYDFSNPVTASLNLYAKWVTEPPAEITVTNGSTLYDKLRWIKDNARSNAIYTVEVNADEGFNSKNTLSYTGKNDITIKLVGIGEERIIKFSYSNDGNLFVVETGVTLILDNNITLEGTSNGANCPAIVRVNSGGSLIMNTGSKITKGRSIEYKSPGGGVAVYGTFTMNGGEISDCIRYSPYSDGASYGGGVYVAPNRTFIMNDGKITGNSAPYGGGVYVDNNAIFTMNGGEISDGHTALMGQYTSTIQDGGGVYIASNGTFTMNNGKISGNTVTDSFSYGGGVAVYGTFTMNDGEISDNKARTGGGVHADTGGTFTMNGGKISGNTATSGDMGGGGVYAYTGGTFTMNGGEISGNTAIGSYVLGQDYGFGGGVYTYKGGTFTKNGGTIYGYDENDTINSNVVRETGGLICDNRGHAAYFLVSNTNFTTVAKLRETTAGPAVNLDSTKDGAEGGWEN